MAPDVVDGLELEEWPSEDIPGESLLYMRVHRNFVQQGKVVPGAFRDHEGGMSTDWEKYSSPEETRKRGRKPAEEYAVISLQVIEVRTIPGQTVLHTPHWPVNRAHTDVIGDKTTEARFHFMRIYKAVLELEPT